MIYMFEVTTARLICGLPCQTQLSLIYTLYKSLQLQHTQNILFFSLSALDIATQQLLTTEIPHGQPQTDHILYCWVNICCCGNVFIMPLPSNDHLYSFHSFQPPCAYSLLWKHIYHATAQQQLLLLVPLIWLSDIKLHHHLQSIIRIQNINVHCLIVKSYTKTTFQR